MKNITIESPKWLSYGSIYQINPRTFSKEGTIRAIIKELDFLEEVGFNIIYLCPVFDESEAQNNLSPRQIKSGTKNPKNPYRINDYFNVDSEYGSLNDLTEFVSKAHEKNMKVILDLVYAHISPDAPIIKKHPEFVCRSCEGDIINSSWNFPALDFRCEGLREYLYCNMIYYISVIDVDGFRCDVGDSVPNDFWYEAHKRMKKIKPDSILINEGEKYERLSTSFNASYCYFWHEALYSVFCEGNSAKLLAETDLAEKQKNFPKGAKLLRDIDNHDTVTDWDMRVEAVAGSDGMEQIEVINYLLDGIPMVYCGNEIACKATLNMFANRFHPGNFEFTDRTAKNTPDAIHRIEIMKRLNKLKRESAMLSLGETEWCQCSDELISFKRTMKDKGIFFIGNSKTDNIKVPAASMPDNLTLKFSNNLNLYDDGSLELGKHGYAVFEY